MRRGTISKPALIAAVALSLGFAALLMTFWVRSRMSRPASDPMQAAVPAQGPVIAPGIADAVIPGAGDRAPAGVVGKGEKFFVQFVDKFEPTRLAGEITADRSIPGENRRNTLINPAAWFFLRDGRTVLVEAREGVIITPPGPGEPPWGQMRGSVRARLYAAKQGNVRPHREDEPLAVFETSIVSVDWSLGQFEAPEAFAFRMVAPAGTLRHEGVNLLAQFDPLTRRIDRLDVVKTTLCEIVMRGAAGPEKSAPGLAGAGQPPTAARDPAANAQTNTAGEAKIAGDGVLTSLFHARVSGGVVARQGNVSLSAGVIDGWVRSVGGQMPEVYRFSLAPSAAPETPQDPTPGVRQGARASVGAADVTRPAQEPIKPIVLSWQGPLAVRRLEAAPAELQACDAFVRCTAGVDAVTFADEERGVRTASMIAEYDASGGTLVMTGGDAARPARALGKDLGELSAPRIELVPRRGVVRAVGAGVLRSLDEPARRRTARWNESAEFTFETRDGRSTTMLREALFTSGAMLDAADGSFARGDQIRARFVATPEATRPQISRLAIIGNVEAQDAEGSVLEADTASLLFGPGERPLPKELTAQGAVRAVLRTVDGADHVEESMRADSLLASFGLVGEPTERVSLERAVASGNVTAVLRDGISAASERISVDARQRTAELEGTQAVPARLSRERSTLWSPVLRIDAQARTIAGSGPGGIDHAEAEGSTALVTWTKEFVYDDAQGVARCVGSADATLLDAAGSTRWVKGDVIEARFDPATPARQPAPPAAVDPSRALRSVTVLADPATPSGTYGVEARVTPATAPASASRTLMLRANRIDADALAGTLAVLGPGLALISDRPAPERSPAMERGREPMDLGAGGDSLFTWKTSMRLSQGGTLAAFVDDVRMVHKPLEGRLPLRMECRLLEARLGSESGSVPGTPAPAGAAGDPLAGRNTTLLSALATGAVWARVGERELTADRVSYDSVTASLEAFGDGPQRVTIADPASPPQTVTRVRVDLKTGRVDADQPGVIVQPR